MLTIFNRRELISVWSLDDLFRIKNALHDANISYSSTVVGAGGSYRARQQFSCIKDKFSEQYRVYVHKSDYDRALRAIQPALRPRQI